MAMLDTTALIDLSRSERSPLRSRVAAVLRQLLDAGEDLHTSRINEAEFRVGGFRAKNRQQETRTIERVLDGFPVLEFDAVAALCFARVKAHLLDHGRPTGDADLLIAAIALANGQSIVTRNAAHFAQIPGLAVAAY